MSELKEAVAMAIEDLGIPKHNFPLDHVAITKKEYEHLVDRSAMLSALQNNGVDNWIGHADAMKEYEGIKENEGDMG